MKKNAKLLKQTRIAILVLALVCGFLCPAEASRADAAPKWKTAYQKLLKNWKLLEKYEDMSYLKMYFQDDYKFDRYFTYDVNKDGTPELFLYSTTMKLTEVLTCKNGKIVALGTDAFYGINKSKKALIVKGHWHGAGGSGFKEWSVYTIGKKKLSQKYYIDNLAGRITIYKNDKSVAGTKSTYNSIYKKYVKETTKFSKFKKYKLSSKKGL